MVEVWRDPSTNNNEIHIKRSGIRMVDGITEGRKVQPPVNSGKGREGSSREEAERRWTEMLGGKK